MARLLLDTHAWVWSLRGDPRLSKTALSTIDDADSVAVSAVSIFEIAQKVRLGKWPEMAERVSKLAEAVGLQGGTVIPVDAEISLAAGLLIWDHRDPFDRMIAATALERNLTLVSADAAFDVVTKRVW